MRDVNKEGPAETGAVPGQQWSLKNTCSTIQYGAPATALMLERPDACAAFGRTGAAFVKRALDIIGSALIIIASAPVMIAAAVAIFLDSGWPIFFASLDDGRPVRRIGRNGRPFRYFKFRTMRTKSDSLRYTELAPLNMRNGSPLVKIRNDPRMTRVGRFLRRHSIDELPELFLVLKGDMSLVGPRPHLPEEVAKYQPWHLEVLTVKPGITGMAQVNGRADLEFDDEIILDIAYAREGTLLTDILILMRTPGVILSRKGAY